MGIDVASFGDFFADKLHPRGRTQAVTIVSPPQLEAPKPAGPAIEISAEEPAAPKANGTDANGTSPPAEAKQPARSGRRHGRKPEDEPINCLVYKDPFSATYKKYIFTEDGKYLLGGMMVGDVGDFVKLVAIVKKKVSQSGKKS